MPQKTNLNVAPYYDDFAQDKNFYKVLFRPGYSIQARELTQLQSILQNQIESFGKYTFKQGELVIPGEVGLNTKLNFVKLSSVSEIPTNVNGNIVYKKYDISLLKGEKLKGLTSGVVASVIESSIATETSSDVVYVNYTNSGDAGNEDTFRQGETLEVVDGVNTPLLVVGTDGSVLPTSISITDPDTGVSGSLESPAMGYASAVKVEEGIYFVNGYFVRNAEQLLVIDDYYDHPSAKVGFKIIESFITSEEDSSLYDNAIGSTNYSAPGANRLKIDLSLIRYDLNQITDKNFIQLITVKSGSVQTNVVQTDYNLLERTLARRTYDESGDYIVDNFSLDIREYYNHSGNLGVYSADDLGNVNGLSSVEAQKKLVGSVGPGKGYIKGYEIVNKETKYLPINKARETLNRSDIRLKTSGLPTYKINNVYGSVPVNTEGSELTAYPNVYLSSVFNDGTIGLNDSEADTDDKQTVLRRGKYFDSDHAIKTIYINKDPSVDLNALVIGTGGNGAVQTFTHNGVADGNRTPGTYTITDAAGGTGGTGADFEITVISGGSVAITMISGGDGYIANETITISDSDLGGGGGNPVTITVTLIAAANTTTTKELRRSALDELWFIQERSTSLADAVVKSVNVIGYSEVSRLEVNSSTSVTYIELTVAGRKDYLDTYFKEYDENSADNFRRIFRSKSDAENDSNSPFGRIVDYNETITPLIGTVKPSNFTLIEKGDGFNPDSDIVVSKGRQDTGAAVYNSTFSFSYFDPQFFTKILLDEPITVSGSFSSGQYVYGLESGAYGVVEGTSTGQYTTNKTLMVKTLFGNFKSGEAIRDESNNTLRIAKDNTISHLIVNNRGTNYVDGTLLRIDGVDYDGSKIKLTVPGGTIVKADIENRALVSTEYSRPPIVTVIQGPNGGTPSAAVVTAVLVRNSVRTYTPQDVKSFYSAFGAGNTNIFTSDVEVNREAYTDVISVTDFTFDGDEGRKYLECNGFAGDATKFLKQGDLIQYSDVNGNTNRSVVQQATKSSGVLKSRVYLDRSLNASVSNASIVKFNPKINNFNQGSLLYKTGSKEISSIVYDSTDSKISYYIRKDFVSTGTGGSGKITFSAPLPFGTQRFVSFTESNFLVTVLDAGDAPNVVKGDIVYVTSDQVIIESSTDAASGLTAGSVKLDLPSTYFGGTGSYSTYPTLKLTATLEVTKAKPRLKSAITNKRIVIDSLGDSIIPFRGRDYDTDAVETYSYADAYKLRYVYEGTPTEAPTADKGGSLVTGTDVTSRYTFDDGQRDTIYDVSRIILKPGFDVPTGKLLIAFDYFDHTQGDFCTVDSYLHEAGVGPEEIPTFNSPSLGNVSLTDVLDFRPKVDNDAILSGFSNNSLLSASNTRSFTGPGGVISSTPASDNNLEFTFSFQQTQYLDRIDALFLNKKGEFIIKEGNSSLNPSKPDAISDAVPLYYIYVPAYTQSSKDVKIVPVDNKRYTMRDIGKLEKRIERLEYYTTLSVLEQQALNMHVADGSGLSRFKSGFIVDNFETHKIGSLQSLDYKCSVDTQQSVMRPQSKEDSFKLEEINTRDDQRSVSGYKRTGDRVTLPYTELKLLGNDFATKKVNPNPFVVLQYVGDSFITPSVDSWYDDSVAPLVTDNNTNLYSIFLAKNELRDAFSSLFNSYKINWLGANKSFFNIGSFADTNTNVSTSTIEGASVSSSSNVSVNNNEIGKGISTKGIGSNVVATSLSFFARSIAIKFIISRLKPNTNLHVFMEGQNIARWVNPDLKYTGIAGNSLTTFNSSITTDENGNASGIILVPAGKPPRENAVWSGNPDTVVYDDSGNEVRFTTGSKTIRFTSSSTDSSKDSVDTYTEVKYYATGLLPENPSSIVSTSPSYFKANEGTQVIDSNTANPVKPNPLAQSFTVDGFEGGLFTTGIDLFFAKKSSNIPLRVYLTDVQNGKPGKNIIPGTQKVLTPDTYLRVVASDTLYVSSGENVTGSSSNASGPINKVYDKNNIEVVASTTGVFTLNSDQVYTLALSNHNGTSFVQDELLSIPSVTVANNTNNTTNTVKIVKDSGSISDLRITSTGDGYDSAILTIESPQLPGGGTATGIVRVSGGKIYHSELIVFGSEYTEPPAVVIRGTGTGNAGAEIQSVINIDTPAVRMGIATDQVGVTDSTIPTKFKFDYPVYLENDTEYSLQVETDSIDYMIWASRLGDVEVATSTTVTTQPALGSLFKSQNTGNWTEDLFEDLKFKLYRAEFDTSRSGSLLLTNEDLGYESLNVDPIETNASSDTIATSTLFKNNNFVVKVNHHDNGFDPDGNSHVFFKSATDVGGVTASQLNTELFKVTNTGVDHYNITSSNRASSNSFGGGNVLASYNRKFEKINAVIPNLSFSQTKIDSSVKTTNVSCVDDNIGTFTSYSQSEYEKTFLNEEFYFINQKIISSRINEIVNNIDNSLTYKIDLSSTVSHLSPFIDLSRASIKTITNRIENATGNEDRFGRRNQILKFKDVYTFQLNGIDTGANEAITDPSTSEQTLTGETTKAKGSIIKVSGTTVWVKLDTVNSFAPGEKVVFSLDTFASQSGTGVTVAFNSIKREVPQIPNIISPATDITAVRPTDPTDKYTNKITGTVVIWNEETEELTLINEKHPINGDYTSSTSQGVVYNRNASSTQVDDIFRVGDIISWEGQDATQANFVEISHVSYSNGIDYTSDIQSKNSSTIAKYVTKEVTIQNPATAIDVKITANTSDIKNIGLLYRLKKSSSQENFDDIEWVHFNGTGLPDVDVVATAENSISGITEKQSSYQELTYSVEDLPEFSSFAVKVIMKSNNPAFVPKIQDLRAVASY